MQTEPLSSKALATEDESAPHHESPERTEIPTWRKTLTAASSIALATEDQPPVFQSLTDGGPAISDLGPRTSDFNLAPTIIDAKPVPATAQRHKARRTGRVACLPKIQRDMVNRMLSNGVPYKNIVAALDEGGFFVTERNISSWATGGHLEWRFEQDLVLQNRLVQDHLVDHLRRDDASELPEVGLQAAATRISQILLQKTACAQDVEPHLGTFSQMVDVLCRLNREIGILQKQRDDSRRTLGRAHDPARVQDADQMSAIENERYYSDPPPSSKLAKPAVPPALPPIPTSTVLAEADQEAEHLKKLAHQESFLATLQALNGKKAPGPELLAPPPKSNP